MRSGGGGNVLHSGTEEQFETLESYEAEVRGLTLIAGVLGTEGMQGRVEFL